MNLNFTPWYDVSVELLNIKLVYEDSISVGTPIILKNKTTYKIEIKQIKYINSNCQIIPDGKEMCFDDNVTLYGIIKDGQT